MQRRFSNPYLHLAHSCWYYAGGRRWQMAVFYFLDTLASIATVIQPFAIGKLINSLQQGGSDTLQKATEWLGLYMGLMFLFWLFHGPARVIERNLGFHIKKRFLQHYYDLLTHLPMYWHRDNHTGNTINRVNKATSGLSDFAEMQFIYVENTVRFIGTFLMLLLISPTIALVVVAFSLVIIAIVMRFDRILIPLYDEVNEREHLYSSSFFDTASNIASVISFNLAGYKRQRLQTALDGIQVPLKKEIIINELKWFTMMMLVVAAEFLVMFLYMRHNIVLGGAMMLGSLVAVYQYMTRLNFIFFDFAANYQHLVQQHTDVASVGPLAASYEEHGIRDEGKPELAVTGGAIRFDQVHFAYENGAKVFDGLSLSIAPGQKVGLVGRSGAGKTTLIHLLQRFYDTGEDGISIDGQAIMAVTHESLCRSIAVIPQDTSLFEATLLENIRCGRLDATDEEVMHAARKAHAHEFITQQRQGYDAMVGERGVKLSAGQRQRIAIARAVLKNAPILVLDEATSALDSESEGFIQESLTEVMEGKTVIAVAHRLSTIAHLDRLIILEAGRIVEEGSHAELLKKGGSYAKLWGLQSGGFLPD